MSRRLESEVVVLVLDRFLCFIVDVMCFIVDVRLARLVLIVLVRLCVGAVFGDLDSEPYSLTTLVSSAGLSSSPAAKEPPCRPGRRRSERAPNYDVVSGARIRRPWWAESFSVA